MNATDSAGTTPTGDHTTGTASERLSRWMPVLGAIAMALVIGGFYVFREHLAPADSLWLYLLLLACPLIHLFAHVRGPAPRRRTDARKGNGAQT